jgi:hypothetical protein
LRAMVRSLFSSCYTVHWWLAVHPALLPSPPSLPPFLPPGLPFLTLVASCLRGALPPVDLRAVCLVRAIVVVAAGEVGLSVCWWREGGRGGASKGRACERSSYELGGGCQKSTKIPKTPTPPHTAQDNLCVCMHCGGGWMVCVGGWVVLGVCQGG